MAQLVLVVVVTIVPHLIYCFIVLMCVDVPALDFLIFFWVVAVPVQWHLVLFFGDHSLAMKGGCMQICSDHFRAEFVTLTGQFEPPKIIRLIWTTLFQISFLGKNSRQVLNFKCRPIAHPKTNTWTSCPTAGATQDLLTLSLQRNSALRRFGRATIAFQDPVPWAPAAMGSRLTCEQGPFREFGE